MTVDTGPGRKPSLLEHLRRLHLRRATGLLRATLGGRTRELSLVDGELHFRPDHPFAPRLVEIRGRTEPAARQRGWHELHGQLLPLLEGRDATAVELRAGSGALPADLVGPLPTSALLRRAWRERLAGAEPVPILGARVTRDGGAPADPFGWSPEELWVLERLRQPMTLAELERDRPMPAEVLSATLAGLEAVERVVAATEGGRLATPAAATASGELALRLRERIAESLADEPLDLPAGEAQRRLVEKLSVAGGQNHYELLGVAPGASADEVQAAFEGLARLVLPEQADRLGLGARRDALAFLFERATDAYRVLADPDLRLAYDREQGIDAAPPAGSEAERREETRRVARALFRQAQMEEQTGEVYTAVQLLEQAALADARAEYLTALGRLLARNPAWLSRALEAYRRALELDPQSGAIRYALGQLHERAGDVEQARHAFQSAAAATPPHPEARAALARLGAREGDAGSRLGKLFRRE